MPTSTLLALTLARGSLAQDAAPPPPPAPVDNEARESAANAAARAEALAAELAATRAALERAITDARATAAADVDALRARLDAPPPADKTELRLTGLFTVWGLTQQNFLLGADHSLDDTMYTVQMLRVGADARRDDMGIVTRLDLAQGWWGVDNSPNNTTQVVTVDAYGDTVVSDVYNADSLFQNKETAYGVHVDIAYGWFQRDVGAVPIQVRAGRQYQGVGNKLVLDIDVDGVTAIANPGKADTFGMFWGKVSEGQGSVTDPAGTLMSDKDEYADADLWGAVGHLGFGEEDAIGIEVFGLYFWDRTFEGEKTYYPQEMGYLRSRFTPNLSRVLAVGVAPSARLEVADGLVLQGEGDLLTGSDDVPNADHAAGVLDVNNGTLRGWNAYLRATQTIDVGVPLDLGLTLGVGSGDPDPTGGVGNINRIDTMGFFTLTNVWEDSVMPDLEGISPQGLGSPVSRGYREMENTTAVQGRLGIKPFSWGRIDASGTWLRATAPVHGFDETGTPTAETASDLGIELDADATVFLGKGLLFKSQGGLFLPGRAAGLLINGVDQWSDPAWELKNVFVVEL